MALALVALALVALALVALALVALALVALALISASSAEISVRLTIRSSAAHASAQVIRPQIPHT